MDVKLNFINRSSDTNNSSVVIFQKNVATSFDELAIAWKVIEKTGSGDSHAFHFPVFSFIGASDSWGNHTPLQPVQNGAVLQMELTNSGAQLLPVASVDNAVQMDFAVTANQQEVSIPDFAASAEQLQVANALPQGALNVSVYKDGTLLAAKTSVVPGEKAVFEFKPTIWVGVASEVEQGQVMNSAIISSINTELSLLGIASADIVMTGGGPGKDAPPLVFTLENIVPA
ncbi:hypothetical protein [Undibacterium pigrum]|uniref:Aromatic ring-opening dioxygenase LigA n=1 Tax=Undibacterium pigrum TaxID=401470 RepID=A0A318J5D5_9BURK|nr:hypothetical protein [Undibacterium pigrum]PXX42623.1 hypothetical protein DFR42_105281 [Undibacterium pigrum]